MRIINVRGPRGVNSSKILFITHKEYISLTGHLSWSILKKIVFFHEYIKVKIFSITNKIIFLLNYKKISNTVKIVHWGVTLDKPIPYYKKFGDVHLSDKKSAAITNKYYNFELVFPITSKDFEAKEFYKKFSELNFCWDIITVSHNSKRKCLDDCLLIIRQILDNNPQLTALLIINTPSKIYRNNNLSSSVNFLKLYHELFSYKERQQIVLLRISDEMGLEGASPSFIRWAMSNSKIFLFASKKEGSAKVLTEAQNANCKIIAREGLTGGSYDNLNKNNFFTWSNRNQASLKILELLKNETLEKINHKNIYVNEKSVKKLEEFLKKRKLIPCDHSLNLSDFEFANRWLPEHLSNKKYKNITSDKDNPIKLLRFFNDLKKI